MMFMEKGRPRKENLKIKKEKCVKVHTEILEAKKTVVEQKKLQKDPVSKQNGKSKKWNYWA